MKFLTLVFVLLVSLICISATAQPVLTVTERKVTVANGASYSSFKSNDEAIKGASSLAAAACAVNPNSKVYGRITFEYTCSKTSASASSRSVSSVPQSSSSAASSVEPAKVSVLTWQAPTCRELKTDQTVCTPLALSEIKEYNLVCNDRVPEKINSTGASIEYTTRYVAPGTKCSISTVDTAGRISISEPVVDTRI